MFGLFCRNCLQPRSCSTPLKIRSTEFCVKLASLQTRGSVSTLSAMSCMHVLLCYYVKLKILHDIELTGGRRGRYRTYMLIRSLIVANLDYCNSLLVSVSNRLLSRLQSVLSTTAWVIFSAPRTDRVTPLLCELHWL